MFKKAFKVASHEPIAPKDRKKLKRTLYKAFNEEAVDRLFIDSSELSETKLSTKAIIYSNQDFPLFVDITGSGDFIPSIYGLDMYPDLVKSFELKSTKDAHVKKGKNPDWSDIVNIADNHGLLADDVVGIMNSNGEIVGVGALAGPTDEIISQASPSGPAIYVLHYEGDTLWEAGSKKHEEVIWCKAEEEEKQAKLQKKNNKKDKKNKKNASSEEEEDDQDDDLIGFVRNAKTGNALDNDALTKKGKQRGKNKIGLPQVESKKSKQGGNKTKGGKKNADSDIEEEEATNKKGAKKGKKGKKDFDTEDFEINEEDDFPKKSKKGGKKDQKHDAQNNNEDDAGHHHQNDSDEEDNNNKKGGKKGGKKPTKKKEKAVKVDRSITSKMDIAIKEAFLNAVKVSIDPKNDIPMETSKLWSEHMIPCRNVDLGEIDLKLSSYQKLGKFLAHLQKEELLEFTEATKKDPVPMITKIDYGHDTISDWEPTVDGPVHNNKDKASNAATDFTVKTTVEDLLKPVKKSVFVLFKDHLEGDAYSKEAIIKSLDKYIKEHKIIVEGKTLIVNPKLEELFPDQLTAIAVVEGVDDPISHEADEDDENDDEAQGKKHGKKTRGEASQVFTRVYRSEIENLLLKAMKPCYRVTNLAANDEANRVVTYNGEFPKIQLHAEHVKGKNATTISGVEILGIDSQKLSKHLGNLFDCSVTVTNAGGTTIQGEKLKIITLNGVFFDESKEFLTMECKIPEEYIEEVNKIGGRKKEGLFK